jgi:hypothetical protein
MLPITAHAKPFKIENSQGKLIRCGDLKNTENAYVVRDCPELGDFLDHDPNPEPTPVPTPEPTANPTSVPMDCSDGTFNDTQHGLQIERFYQPGVVQHLCARIPKLDLHSIEVQSVNRANAQCNMYIMMIKSPTGKKYESVGVQPGPSILNEQGTWQFDIILIDDIDSLCADNKALQTTIRTKG